ncbi:putative polysaccharide biosynthesis protein [Cytobacillus purgationiresistens]|uniref:PST family polysaccharide transporter n=1 Tax=Cytobacillus purgationiresistens TaxID=863449 RepID=A0ABU0ARP1_9BACI|nr:oligosaccharide flippase family protein [Cytobacillus purgationiresistens]MDQ0273093.1 PST family polysaccharide transporter [Cytobacillus purgationiresistens]
MDELKPVHQSNGFFKGTLILTAAAIIIKILSATYRVPFQNIVGDVGFYIYQQIYPFYGIALVLATSGFPVVISKLYAEQASEKGRKPAQNLFVISAIVISSIGFMGFSFLYWGADWFAIRMDDPELAGPLRVVSFIFLLLPVISLLRGYFQGEENMVPTAISQVSEQFIRVAIILFTAILFTKQGYSLYEVGGGAFFGSIAGGLAAVIILLVFLYKEKKSRPYIACGSLRMKGSWQVVKSLLIHSFAICVSSLLLIFIQLADSLNLYSLLVSSGFGELESKQMKGVYDRGQPLIQLGLVAATSMALSLVPLITKEKMKKDEASLYGMINLVLRMGLVIGVAATAGLWSIIEPTNIMLFENAKGSEVLAILSFLILFGSLIITVTAILQGLGYILYPAFIILIGCIMKYILNIIYVPKGDIAGAAIASCIALCIILILLLAKLKIHVKAPLVKKRFVFLIVLAAGCMVLSLSIYLQLTNGLYSNGDIRLVASFQALSGAAIGAVVYLYIVLKGKVFTEKELLMLPFGSKLTKLL